MDLDPKSDGSRRKNPEADPIGVVELLLTEIKGENPVLNIGYWLLVFSFFFFSFFTFLTVGVIELLLTEIKGKK